MMVYRRRERHPLKWVLAAIIFIVAMTITFSDVSGINVANTQSDSKVTEKANDRNDSYDIGDDPTDEPNDDVGEGGGVSDPSNDSPGDSKLPVPEPATLIILASGLAVLYAARFGKKQK
jgi:hypothetical protein